MTSEGIASPSQNPIISHVWRTDEYLSRYRVFLDIFVFYRNTSPRHLYNRGSNADKYISMATEPLLGASLRVNTKICQVAWSNISFRPGSLISYKKIEKFALWVTQL